MNTVVEAVTVTTLTTEVEQLVSDSNAGIANHSQWRYSTCGALLPATSVYVENLHIGEKLKLLSTVVHVWHSLLVSTPQVKLMADNSGAVTVATSGFPPSIRCDK